MDFLEKHRWTPEQDAELIRLLRCDPLTNQKALTIKEAALLLNRSLRSVENRYYRLKKNGRFDVTEQPFDVKNPSKSYVVEQITWLISEYQKKQHLLLQLEQQFVDLQQNIETLKDQNYRLQRTNHVLSNERNQLKWQLDQQLTNEKRI